MKSFFRKSYSVSRACAADGMTAPLLLAALYTVALMRVQNQPFFTEQASTVLNGSGCFPS